jgi:hypothetical protein
LQGYLTGLGSEADQDGGLAASLLMCRAGLDGDLQRQFTEERAA